MYSLVLNLLILAGACILIASLIPVRQLISQPLPESLLRKWMVLAALIVLFIAGYIGYGVLSWGQNIEDHDLIVPVIFFFGACFVWLVSNLSLKTVFDVKRVAFLEQENITDSLVAVYNRRYLERRLEEEFARAKRQHLNLSLLMLDIDHFKTINDTYGHASGDDILRHCGTLLNGVLRLSDILARFGGEEFVVILPHAGEPEAIELAERLRQRIEAREFPVRIGNEKHGVTRITISIGIACLDREIESAKQLLQNADEAMYRAKHKGRNRVALYAKQR